MSKETFEKVIGFAKQHHTPLLLSGGEPTEHPDFLKFCQRLEDEGLPFMVATNGTWVLNDSKEIEEVSRMSMCISIQVYSNPKWYKDYWQVFKNRKKLESIKKVCFINSDILSMQALGRAKKDARALKEAKMNKYTCSCLKCALTARQTPNWTSFFAMMLMQNSFCTPLVDFKGMVHLSESHLCPSVGNIDDADLFEKIKSFKPCLGCEGGKKLMRDTRPNYIQAKEMLGL